MTEIALVLGSLFIGWHANTIYSLIWCAMDEKKQRQEEHYKFRNRYKTYLFWTSDKAVMK